jgi:beta-galactosidase
VKNETESVEVLWRGFSQALTQNCGLWFMDQRGLWEGGQGAGWYGSPAMVSALRQMHAVMANALPHPQARACEVAAFIDLAGAFYVADTDHNDRALLHRLYTRLLASMNRAGAPFDLYQIEDLEDPGLRDYRALVFLDAFHLSDARMRFLENLEKNGKTLVFLSVPGCISDSAFDPQRTERLCVPEDNLAEFRRLIAAASEEPFEKWTADGKLWRRGRVWYNPGPELAPAELRKIFAEAGAHSWLSTDDVLMVGGGCVAVHASSEGEKELRAPAPATWTDLRTGMVLARAQPLLRFPMRFGETRLFAITA